MMKKIIFLVLSLLPSIDSACTLCPNGEAPPKSDIGPDYAGEEIVITQDNNGDVITYRSCDKLDQDAKGFTDDQCEELAESPAAFLCECPDAPIPDGYGNCELCPNDDIVVSDDYVDQIQEACWYGELEAPLYSDDECGDFIEDYQDVCCKKVNEVPFTAAALDYTGFDDTTMYNEGTCGDGAVDAQFTSDSICQARGADCNIGWTEEGEWVEYAFTSTSDRVDITARVASPSSGKKFSIGVGSHKEEFEAPGEDYQVFRDVVAANVPVRTGRMEAVKVKFLSARVNLCSITVAEAGSPTDPPTEPPTDPPTDPPSGCSLCPGGEEPPREYTIGADYAGEEIAITQPDGEVVYYYDCDPLNQAAKGFTDDQCEELAESPAAFLCECPDAPIPDGYGNCALCPNDDIIVSDDYVNEIQESCLYGKSEALLYSDDECGDFIEDYQDVCCKKLNEVPFTAAALDYTGFDDINLYNKGDCGDGAVDAQFTSDSICQARGADCNIGWTEEGEWVEYAFTSTSDRVDITARVASPSSGKTLSIGVGSHKEEFEAPGEGPQIFRDVVAANVPVRTGRTEAVKVTFLAGRINLCSITVTEAGSPTDPPTEPPSTPEPTSPTDPPTEPPSTPEPTSPTDPPTEPPFTPEPTSPTDPPSEPPSTPDPSTVEPTTAEPTLEPTEPRVDPTPEPSSGTSSSSVHIAMIVFASSSVLL